MARDYIDLKIDTDRDLNGAAVAARLRGGQSGGIPWMVITDSSGTELVTSDGPKGNIGCPVQPHEVAWFVKMLETTQQRLGTEGLAAIESALNDHALAFRR